MTVVVHYSRYHAPHTHECETVEEGVRFLAWGEDRGELTHHGGKVIEDGVVVLEGEELSRRVYEAWDKL